MNFVFATILFLLLNAIEYSSCERFNIVPSPGSPCPGEFTGEPCLTLQQYVANPSLSSNITFELQPGNHRLDSQLQVQNINSFIMRANTTATVTCRQLDRMFYFNRLQQVHVSGITFVGCRMYLWYVTNATLERSITFDSRMELQYVTNATVERSSFFDGRCCEAALIVYHSSSVLIRQCIVSNFRSPTGAIYGYNSNFIIEQAAFRNNFYPYYGCCSNSGAIYIGGGGNLNILNSNFSDNSASHGAGGAIYFDGNNITITNSNFVNNTAIAGGGGAIHSVRRYTNITLVNNIFFNNTAAYCGALEITEFYHDNINITGNTFTYNRAIRQISGKLNNGGGVICIRNASVLFLDNNFSNNSAAGDAGVIQADESDVIIERSIFSNNSVGGNGGVLHTYFYPTIYTVTNSSFTNNRAGGDGGVMYVGRASSHVIISQSTFSFNTATERGGVVAIIGSNLEINSGSIFENDAAMGEIVSACNSVVTITNVGFHAVQDPTYSFCSLYDHGTTIITPSIENITTTAPITVDITTTALAEEITTTEDVTTTEDIITTAPATTITASTAAEDTTTIAPTTEDVTMTEDATTEHSTIIMTATAPQPDTTTTAADSITVAKITPPHTAMTTTSQVDDQDNQQDTGQTSLHTIVPGYVAIGAVGVLLVLGVLFGVIILVKMFKVKQPPLSEPPRVNCLNFNAYEYPTIKN